MTMLKQEMAGIGQRVKALTGGVDDVKPREGEHRPAGQSCDRKG